MSLLRDVFGHHAIARRLVPRFDPERLAIDLARVHESWWARHQGPYHDGSWESVALWAPRGDMREQTSKGGDFTATPALRFCPYVAEVLGQFPAERNRVRLMRLRPGGKILRHSDPLHTIARDLVRLHVPMATNAGVRFLVNDVRVPLLAGETWHVDVRFPHEVANEGATMRVHLVMDLILNPEMGRLLDEGTTVGSGFLTGYYLRHMLPKRLKRLLGISGN
jgi:hypothetical protein